MEYVQKFNSFWNKLYVRKNCYKSKRLRKDRSEFCVLKSIARSLVIKKINYDKHINYETLVNIKLNFSFELSDINSMVFPLLLIIPINSTFISNDIANNEETVDLSFLD